MDRKSVLAWRLVRQGLAAPAQNREDYGRLLQALQPVTPIHFSMPGSPPRLEHRVAQDDAVWAEELRGRRQLVKGRFWGGNIGYVLAADLELYGAAFCKPLNRYTAAQEEVLRTLQSTGPLSPRQIREECGLQHKKIMPALHRLQRAFMVYEDQEDSSWERPWCLFEAEWPKLNFTRLSWDQAATEVLLQFLASFVFATYGQLREWSQFPVRDLRRVLGELEKSGRIVPLQVEGLEEGWMRAEDEDLEAREPARGTFMLHKADPLVKPCMGELKERFAGRELLQFLLVDGELAGAVCGHWRIGPHDVDDIVPDLPAAQLEARRDEIIAAVAAEYHPPHSRILRFAGQIL